MAFSFMLFPCIPLRGQKIIVVGVLVGDLVRRFVVGPFFVGSFVAVLVGAFKDRTR
jgi:hypothetical protein